jgi:alpha-mannosidase
VLNDGKYSSDVSGSAFRQTVLRCPPYAYHKPPHTFGSKIRYDWLDQGAQEFTLVVRPHLGAWQTAGIQRRSNELNLPPVLITQHAHAGKLLPCGSLCELRNDGVELAALKPAETGEGIILRLVERFGAAQQVELLWQGKGIGLNFRPFEIKTLLLQLTGSAWKGTEVDMLERIIENQL